MMKVNSIGICVCCISIMIRYSDSDNFVVTIISSLSINQLYDMLLNIFFKMTEVTDYYANGKEDLYFLNHFICLHLMVRSQINRQKSIQRGRLVFYFNTELLINKVFENLDWLIFLALPLLPLMNKSNKLTFTSLCLTVAFVIFMLVSLYLMNHLILIKGSNPTLNRLKMVQILKHRYPSLKIDDSGQNIIKFKKETGLFSWGKEITVLFEEKQVYINSTTLGRYHMKSPVHSIFNTISMLQIRKDFQQAEAQGKSTAPN